MSTSNDSTVSNKKYNRRTVTKYVCKDDTLWVIEEWNDTELIRELTNIDPGDEYPREHHLPAILFDDMTEIVRDYSTTEIHHRLQFLWHPWGIKGHKKTTKKKLIKELNMHYETD